MVNITYEHHFHHWWFNTLMVTSTCVVPCLQHFLSSYTILHYLLKHLSSIQTQDNIFTCLFAYVSANNVRCVGVPFISLFSEISCKILLMHLILCHVSTLVLAWRYPCVIWVGPNVFTTKCAFSLLSNCSEYSKTQLHSDRWLGCGLIWHNWLYLNHALHGIRTEWEITTVTLWHF